MSGVKTIVPAGRYLYRQGIRLTFPYPAQSCPLLPCPWKIEINPRRKHVYKGVSASVKDGKVTGITDTNTGTHKEIRVVGEEKPVRAVAVTTHTASWDVWML